MAFAHLTTRYMYKNITLILSKLQTHAGALLNGRAGSSGELEGPAGNARETQFAPRTRCFMEHSS